MIFKWCNLHVTFMMRLVPYTRGRERTHKRTAMYYFVISMVHLCRCVKNGDTGIFQDFITHARTLTNLSGAQVYSC